MIKQKFAVEIGLDVIANRDNAQCVPLTKRRRLDSRRGKLAPTVVVVIEPEVILKCVGPYDVVFPFRKPEHDSAGGIFPAGNWLEPNRDVDICIWTSRNDDDIEITAFRSNHENPFSAPRISHLFHRPI